MRGNSKTNLVIALIFSLGIFLPLIWQVFPALNFSQEINEKRELAKWPTFNLESISTYPERFEKFYNDHFGLRNTLIYLNNTVRFKVFNSSGSPNVLIGKDGWLFLNEDQTEEGAPVSNHLGLLPFNYDIVFQTYKNDLEAKSNYLTRRGIRYVFVIAPDKWTVYPEYLPDGFANYTRKKNVDLLVEYLRVNTQVEILDLRTALVNSKQPDQLLYYRNDTHWNKLGAYVAYKEIANSISRYFPEIKPRTIYDFEVTKKTIEKPMGLENMLSLKAHKDTYYELTPRKPYSYVNLTEAAARRGTRQFKRAGASLPRALVFRDSFLSAVIPYLADDFSHSTYIWSNWHSATDIDSLIRTLNPDIVIEEMVERYLVPGIGLKVF